MNVANAQSHPPAAGRSCPIVAQNTHLQPDERPAAVGLTLYPTIHKKVSHWSIVQFVPVVIFQVLCSWQL
jgi:hypothetical protein